jgi:hypothetical protein
VQRASELEVLAGKSRRSAGPAPVAVQRGACRAASPVGAGAARCTAPAPALRSTTTQRSAVVERYVARSASASGHGAAGIGCGEGVRDRGPAKRREAAPRHALFLLLLRSSKVGAITMGAVAVHFKGDTSRCSKVGGKLGLTAHVVGHARSSARPGASSTPRRQGWAPAPRSCRSPWSTARDVAVGLGERHSAVGDALATWHLVQVDRGVPLLREGGG